MRLDVRSEGRAIVPCDLQPPHRSWRPFATASAYALLLPAFAVASLQVDAPRRLDLGSSAPTVVAVGERDHERERFSGIVTIAVPGDFPTIQQAIDAASVGDVVEVEPGTYAGPLDISGKEIVVRSSGGADLTTISTGSALPIVSFTNVGSTAVLEGFTLSRGPAGAISMTNADPTVRDCVIERNSVTLVPGEPGSAGVRVQGGSPTFVQTVVVDNETTDNSATSAGAFYVDGAELTLVHCTIADNDPSDAADAAAIVNAGGSTIAIDNSVLWNDGLAGAVEIVTVGGGTTTVRHSDVRGGFAGPGNIDLDPLLSFGERRLREHSPCTDAGDNALATGLTLDRGGAPRFVDDPTLLDTGAGTSPTVDIGAYERQQGAVNPAVVVTGLILEDNGDDDGWADSDETVQARARLWNRLGRALSDVEVRLSSSDPRIACISQDSFSAAALAPGEEILTPPFTFVVADVQRVSVDVAFTAAFSFAIDSDLTSESSSYLIELDLDTSGGQSETAFSESFEGGSLNGTSFQVMNLDAGIHGSPNSADGYRCQYSDPDWLNSDSYGEPQASNCYPGASQTHADATFWRIDSNRSSKGIYSLHYGIDLVGGLGFTTPIGTLEAARTLLPVNINYGHVCSIARHIGCATAAECPPGESCERVAPELSFFHQTSLLDGRSSGGVTEEETIDRAVVQLQLLDQNEMGDWQTIEPYQNPYDATPQQLFANCSFDPVDDGNTEDDFFDSADPDRRLGPSSTCAPFRVFAYMGNTVDPSFSGAPGDDDVGPIGRAIDGPGKIGDIGLGTWVESRFSLERYRGRRLRLRFLASSMKVSTFESWEAIFGYNPNPGDDGWFIDEVKVSDMLAQPATISVDATDNSALRVDGDGDGTVDSCDCAPADASDAVPGEVTGLLLDHAGAAGGVSTLQWSASAGSMVSYDTLRSDAAASFGASLCVESADGADTTASDGVTPAAGEVLFFLVRGRSACGVGVLSPAQGVGPDCG